MMKYMYILMIVSSFMLHRINWIAIIFLSTIGGLYGRFRFGKGGDMIKIYELPMASSRMNR